MNDTTILIVDDDADTRFALARFLGGEGFGVLQARDGHAVSANLQSRFSLVLLDINLPGESGFDIVKRLRLERPRVGLILLTGRNDLLDRVLGLELGADDYIAKPFQPRELLARIRSVLRRVEFTQPDRTPPARTSVLEFAGWRLDIGLRILISPKDASVELTTTEYDLLRVLCEHMGAAVGRDLLYKEVRGKEWSPLDRTLDNHVANLRRKLSECGGGHLIKTVHGKGYVLAA